MLCCEERLSSSGGARTSSSLVMAAEGPNVGGSCPVGTWPPAARPNALCTLIMACVMACAAFGPHLAASSPALGRFAAARPRAFTSVLTGTCAISKGWQHSRSVVAQSFGIVYYMSCVHSMLLVSWYSRLVWVGRAAREQICARPSRDRGYTGSERLARRSWLQVYPWQPSDAPSHPSATCEARGGGKPGVGG